MNHYEIEACVLQARKGDSEELLKLFEQYKSYIFKSARQYNIKGYDMYDLVQIGYVALINAVMKYKASQHTFTAYAFSTINNAFRVTARNNSKFSSDVSLNTPLDSLDDGCCQLVDSIDSLESLEEDILRAESIKEVKKAVSNLPADEMELIIMVYYNNCSLKTYAIKKGLSYPHILRKKNRIFEKLRVNLR